VANDAPTSATSCLVLSNDFFFGSRLCEAIKGRGHQVTMAATLDTSTSAIPEAAWQLVLFDLTVPTITVEDAAAWRQTLTPPPPLVAFGPHVRTGQLERAKLAGCDLVLTRGQLDQQLELVLDEHLPH